tara:strand:- start:635 stop:1024 length:390 start_codon:yes stop_codon:yes gene_type:complete
MNKLNKEDITGMAALLVHAARIDEKYTDKEKKLIKSFINSYLQDSNLDLILNDAETLEKNSNQLLNFTNIIKKKDNEMKSDIIKHLWEIIISDKSIDQYESNLVRRICGLIYFSDKLSAEIKLQILNSK